MSGKRGGAGEYRIGIGAATLGLRMVPRRYEEVLPGYFNRPSAPGTPDLRVTIRVTTDPVPTPLPDSLYYGKDVSAGRFRWPTGWCTGGISAAAGAWSCGCPSRSWAGTPSASSSTCFTRLFTWRSVRGVRTAA